MQTPAIEVIGLGHGFGGPPLFEGLDLKLGPGLHWIVGDESRGKTTLLHLLAGQLAPRAGSVRCAATGPVWIEDPLRQADDSQVARAWLDARRGRHRAWNPGRLLAAAEAFGLDVHLDKPLYQLSAGSRRKVGLAGAIACGADAVFLDQPFSALDPPSCRVLQDVFDQVAAADDRIWVVADYTAPPAVAAAHVIDLDALGSRSRAG